MLEKYDIEVDMAESAEQAIEYLKNNRPDAIFMDHLMPGMDGLQAVQAIKGNPQTAMIPIMMYTSQEGELYVGQARALGAMGVLPKQVRPGRCVESIVRIAFVAGPARHGGTRAGARWNSTAACRSRAAARGRRRPAGVDWGRRLESAVKDQAVDVRRFIVASLDSFAVAHRQRRAQCHADPGRRPDRAAAAGRASVGMALGRRRSGGCLVAAAFAASWLIDAQRFGEHRAPSCRA